MYKNVHKGDIMTESNKRQKTKQVIEDAMVQLLVFEYLQSEPFLAALLSENGTKEIQNYLRNKLLILVKTDIEKRISTNSLNIIELEYYSVYLSNALFGVCQKWIARGKKESPQEITDFLFPLTNTVSEVFSKK